MSGSTRSVRRLAGIGCLAPALLLLSACGFQPLYGTAVYSSLAGVEIDTGDTRLDYLVRDALEEQFGAGSGTYRLDVDTTTFEQGVGVSAEARVRRYALEIRSSYILSRGTEQLLQSVVTERVYFDVPDDPYALISARLSAEQQGADAVALQIARSVALGIRRAEAGLDQGGEG